MIVVFADLFISIFLFLMFSFLRTMQNITSQEIDDAEITAKDFGVEIRSLPPHESVREFKAALWQWIEEAILEKSPHKDMSNPQTGVIDENQNNLMNITFGLSEYGRMNYLMQMADLYHQKKKLEAQKAVEPEKAEMCEKMIGETNERGKVIMKQMEGYVKTHKSRGVVAFAQF